MMAGWHSHKPIAARHAALRIPDELACPGSGTLLVNGCCTTCHQRIGQHYPENQIAQKHKAPAWVMQTRMNVA